ncbi:MAG: lysophospholipid acyltransferase family protein [Rickettsiales bacterium]|nr:lysophospholipid acyltransferase family protein [Rickettsiales bacterium]
MGHPSDKRPLLMVSNHINYIDILALAAYVPARFTPKVEIGRWPVIGYICKLTGAIFIERKANKIKDAKQPLHDAIRQGEIISLFPESTTNNGVHMLPFKSSFFSLAEEADKDQPLYIQPVAMTYTRINRLPVDSTQWPLIAWYGDMDMVPHLFKFLAFGSVKMELHFLEPVTIAEFQDRKALAQHCHDVIENTIDDIRERPWVKKTYKKRTSWIPISFKSKS